MILLSMEDADSTEDLDSDDGDEDQVKMAREWATRSGVAVEPAVSCLLVKNAFVAKKWTN